MSLTHDLDVMGDEIVDGRPLRRRRGCPFKSTRFGENRAPPARRPREGFGVNQRHVSEVASEFGGPAAAATYDERQRPIDTIGKPAKLLDVPVYAFAVPTPVANSKASISISGRSAMSSPHRQ